MSASGVVVSSFKWDLAPCSRREVEGGISESFVWLLGTRVARSLALLGSVVE